MLEYKFFRVHELQLEEWERIYSPLNVAYELEKMRLWLEANPRRRKKNYNRFVVNWLNREHAIVQRQAIEARRNATVGSYRGSGGAQMSADDKAFYEKFHKEHPELA